MVGGQGPAHHLEYYSDICGVSSRLYNACCGFQAYFFHESCGM